MDVSQVPISKPLTLFYSYVHVDEALRAELEKHLSLLRRQGLISTWYDQQVMPGANWSEETLIHLKSASLILLLISPDFLASDSCSGVEMQLALDRHARGEAQVIPILLRPVDWQGAPFAQLPGLPRDMKPVTSWPNRDEAFLDIARGIRWTIERLYGLDSDAEEALASSSPDDLAFSSLQAMPSSNLTAHEIQNRQRFLRYLRTRYREVFEQSLQGTTLIPPTLRSFAEALDSPTRLIFRHLHQGEQPVQPGTSLLRLYEQAGGELLILGDPGSGKSTLLVYLAHHLLARAERDLHQPCPVIVNLSSWNQTRETLAHWLVEELFTSYQLPRKVGQTWVQAGQVLPLFDGLDEVHESARSACIDAINAYRRDYLVPLIVCSRTREYLAQQRRLMLPRAVEILPLDEEQVDTYLAKAGPAGASVHVLLKQNAVVRELAASPLLLNVLLLTSREAPFQGQDDEASPETQQRQIFANYVERMLAAEGTQAQPMLARLAWLAQGMRTHQQTTFFQEQLQPDWLPGRRLERMYDLLAVRLPGVLIGMLMSLIICTFLIAPAPSQLLIYLFLGAVPGGTLIRQALPPREGRLDERQGTFWRALPLRLGVSVLIGAGVGLAMGDLSFGLGAGLYALLLQLLLRTPRLPAFPTARSSRWNRVTHFLRQPALSNGFLAGLLAWVIFGAVEIVNYFTLRSSCGQCGGGGTIMGSLDAAEVFSRVNSSNWTFQGMGGLGYGMSLALAVFFLSWLLSNERRNILLTDRFVWSWRSLMRSLRRPRLIGAALVSGMFIDVGLSLAHALDEASNQFFFVYVTRASTLSFVLSNLSILVTDVHPRLFDFALGAGLAYGLACWFLLGLWQSVGSETIPAHLRDTPNQGINRSLVNGIWLAVISAVVVAGASFLYLGLGILLTVFLNADILQAVNAMSNSDGVQLAGVLFHDMLSTSLIVGLGTALLAGLLNGWLAYLRHYLVRFLLWRSGMLPWHLSAFLDTAARHILLRRVGAGYSFIHGLLLDYLVALNISHPTDGLPAQGETAPEKPSDMSEGEAQIK